ncbi:jg15764 [Pararge aegeria aegeria]|uniref:Jg15764 protein n=1 Tax=Pararge aegeria aegeria TaxID=348720 RepID=A0A8S4RL27_9NEOP|nr:jg15764 [Pararge aegeria aegeria]
MSDSSVRLKPHGIPTIRLVWLSHTSATQLAAPAIADPPLRHTKMPLQSPKVHREHLKIPYSKLSRGCVVTTEYSLNFSQHLTTAGFTG